MVLTNIGHGLSGLLGLLPRCAKVPSRGHPGVRLSAARDDEHWAVRVHDDGIRHAAKERRLDTRQATGTDHDRLGVKLPSLVADRWPALAFRDTAPNLESGCARERYSPV
jgi:hypothetical protein